jgi:hypothetical protein
VTLRCKSTFTSRSVSIVATSLTPSTKRFQFLNTCRDSRSLTTYAAIRRVMHDHSSRVLNKGDVSE